MSKALQYFSDDYLEQCKQMSPQQIADFIDEFRQLHGVNYKQKSRGGSKLISMKVPQGLLEAFKTKAQLQGYAYQSKIKALMLEWLKEP